MLKIEFVMRESWTENGAHKVRYYVSYHDPEEVGHHSDRYEEYDSIDELPCAAKVIVDKGVRFSVTPDNPEENGINRENQLHEYYHEY